MLKNVFDIPGFSKNPLSVCEITKHCPNLDMTFRGEKCFVLNKRNNKIITPRVK
jgi:hypothetical protein